MTACLDQCNVAPVQPNVGHLNDLKAEFSHAYVRAVAHAAGYFVQESGRTEDADGVDVTIMRRGAGKVVRSPRLAIQLKSTATPLQGDPFAYDLDIKNFNELCDETYQIPRILVVVALPETVDEWVSATEDALVLRHCGYWISLRGKKPSDNTTKCRVKIDRANCFHVRQAQAIMRRIEEGLLP